ncbi:glycoside hydrolase superfamily [Chaetomium strumarium]|uniref:xylan 1,4-beta-xylosidase n=1 Tax=Chaetomium strumarium TaxID=1170767 RepID=A0AAJ0GT46_9PEZI|nr:glycoside hydrolase superfamily [Chaetomium strumarium]
MKTAWICGMMAAVHAIDLPFQKYPDCVNGPLAANKVCDRTLSPAQRAAALVAAMTNEEKLQNLVSNSKGAPRLGLPAYNWWSEALHGVAYAPGTQFRKGPGSFNSSTSFPMPLLMAAAFDDDLIERIGTVIGIEGRAFGNAGFSGMDYWTPNVNPFKDPRWGRGSETPGEDVLRVKRYAASMIRGLEGPGPERRVVATCKHYAANDFEDWNGATRHDFNAVITPQDLTEYYLAPFQQCARDSRVGSIMCAYNAVNGVPSCANAYLLQTVLREHWNWTEHDNYVTSDCEAVLDVSANHHYAPTNAAGTAMCFEAGIDTSCEYTSSSDIPGASAQRLLTWSTVDRALRRLYQGLVRTGYFDGAESPHAALGWADVNTPESQRLALQAAVDGIVLLRNDGTLPLPVDGHNNLTRPPKVAMIGFWADAPEKLSGGYSGTPAFLRSPAFAARQAGWQVKTAGGPVLQGEGSANDSWTAPALDAARDAEYILYFGGLDTTAAGETKDRMTLDWPSAQLALIKRLSQLNKPLVVLQLGDQLDATPLLSLAGINALLWTNWPGQDGGTAIVQLLSGRKSPAGRLPVTQYPSNYTQLVPMTDMALRPSGSSPGRTYRWYPTPVLPFGFGLHYTTFQARFLNNFSNSSFDPLLFPFSSQQNDHKTTIKIHTRDLLRFCDNHNHHSPHNHKYKDTCPLPPLHVGITNTGTRFTSDFVALAFLRGEFGPRPYPLKTLVAYSRVRDVKPMMMKGKEDDHEMGMAVAKLEWTLGDLARRNESGDLVLYPGRYEIVVDEPEQDSVAFEVVGEEVVLDVWPRENK